MMPKTDRLYLPRLGAGDYARDARVVFLRGKL
jgi:hypothetical protein